MAAVVDHAGERLSRAGPDELRREPRRRARPCGHPYPAALHHAVERRRAAVCGGGHGRCNGAHAALRSGCGRVRQRISYRQAAELEEPHHLRHGRNLLRHRLRAGRHAAGGVRLLGLPLHRRRAGTGDRHHHRGGRHDRPARSRRPARCRPGERGRRSGPGLLRQWRNRADRNRRRSRLRLSRSGVFSGRFAGARSRSSATRSR